MVSPLLLLRICSDFLQPNVTGTLAGLEGMNRKVPKSQSGEQDFVDFTAWFYEENGSEAVLHENSVFHRVGGRWLYLGGEVITTPGNS